MPSGTTDLIDLSVKLRSETLLNNSEKQVLQQLNIGVESQRLKLFQLSWIASQQHRYLARLICGDHGSSPTSAFQQTNSLGTIQCTDAYRRLSGHDFKVAELINFLVDNPQLVASLLSEAQNFEGGLLQDIVHVCYSSLYGSCLLKTDEKIVLEVLLNLVKLELVPSSNPRRLLSKGTNSFARLYRLFSESHFGSRVFLTAALHEPIMAVLSGDEFFLDIDPKKATIRFPPAERKRRFGEEGTKQYKDSVDRYRAFVVSKLKQMANSFISSLRQNMHCFPPALAWLIRQIYDHLIARADENNAELSRDDVYMICTDLIFTCFLCPAIANPEPLGIITDIPVSYVARFNLMQVGQILQTLAIKNYEQFDPKLSDIYGQFPTDSVSSMVKNLLETELVPLDDLYPGDASADANTAVSSRSITMIKLDDLNQLLSFLRSVERIMCKKYPAQLDKLTAILAKLPSSFQRPVTLGDQFAPSSPKNPSQSIRRSTSAKLLATGLKFLGADSQQQLNNAVSNDLDADETNVDEVLVLPLFSSSGHPIGLLPEDKVICQDDAAVGAALDVASGKRTRFMQDMESVATSDNLEAEVSSNRSVCSSADEEDLLEQVETEISMMNLNDNLSDVMPASANVSTPSVSGRDTPLSSHQDQQDDEPGDDDDEATGMNDISDSTPANDPNHANSGGIGKSGAVAAGSESSNAGEGSLAKLPVTAAKENRADIQEKFGKFEIPPPHRERHRDETHSLVSDSWSTDVLPSESEYGGWRDDGGATGPQGALPDLVPGQVPDIPRLDLIAEEGNLMGAAAGGGGLGSELGDDRSDTWSVDVLASDSEDVPAGKGQSDDFESVSSSIVVNRKALATAATGLNAAQANVVVPQEIDAPPINPSACFVDAPASAEKAAAASTARSKGARSAIELPGSPEPPRIVDNSHDASGLVLPEVGGNEKLRRQSSGSSFYSKSDVESEFSRDDNAFSEAAHSAAGLAAGSSDRGGSSAMASIRHATDHSGAKRSAKTVNFDPAVDRRPSEPILSHAFVKAADDEQQQQNCKTLNDDGSGGIRFSVQSVSHEAAKPAAEVKSNSDQFVEKRSSGAIPKVPNTLKPGGRFLSGNPDKKFLGKIPSGDDKHKNRLGKNFLSGLNSFKDKVSRVRTDDIIGSGRKTFLNGVRNSNMPASFSSNELSTNLSVSSVGESSNLVALNTESSDDILARYRTPAALVPAANSSTSAGSNEFVSRKLTNTVSMPSGVCSAAMADVSMSELASFRDEDKEFGSKSNGHAGNFLAAVASAVDPVANGAATERQSQRPYYDPSHLQTCQAFLDTKRKLRLVLSSVDVQCLPASMLDTNVLSLNAKQSLKEVDVVLFLHVLLAEALSFNDKSLVAQIRETLRSMALFDNKGVRNLLKALKDDFKLRAVYLDYLRQSRMILLRAMSFFDKLVERVLCEQRLCRDCLIEVCARLFLENKEAHVKRFIMEFQRLEVQDEKTDLLNAFLNMRYDEMARDPAWQHAREEQIARAQLYIERHVISQIYTAAFFPNGDADVSRDQVLNEHMKRLCETITVNHRDLRIAEEYHPESPWPSAQAEIATINAYKTPRDKLQCVERTCEIILNLLKLASGNGVPAADDFMPVLVFVLVKANPPSLMSTIDYVNAFYGSRISGETAYWWTQFCSAIEFIKTMDYM